MNPFELQAQFARQWFNMAHSMTTAAMSACANMNEQTAVLWGRSLPWQAVPAPAPAPFFSFPWLNGTSFPAPMPFSTPFAFNPWQSNPFTSWMALFTGQPASAPAFPTLPFAQTMMPFWTPWAFGPTATAASWTSPLAATSRNPGAELLEQMATNYRTASGYAVAAVIGPLNAALDPRTYGEPWWQKLDKRTKLN